MPSTTLPSDPTVAPSADAGWPTADSTGVPSGTILSPSGELTITTDGAILSGLRIDGNVSVEARNVTIQNSLIIGRVENSSTGLVLRRVEIVGPGTSGAYDSAVGWSNYTCDGCNVHGWGKAFYMEDDVTITNSWVHDLSVSGDPANGGSHNEAIFTQGGSNFIIRGNRLDAGTAPNVSASIALYGQKKAVTDTLVQGNLLNGGGYCLYGGFDAGIAPFNTRIIDNTFGTSAFPKCGKFGAAVAFTSGNGNVWSGNRGGKGIPVAMPGRLWR